MKFKMESARRIACEFRTISSFGEGKLHPSVLMLFHERSDIR